MVEAMNKKGYKKKKIKLKTLFGMFLKGQEMPSFVLYNEVLYRNCSKHSDSFIYYGFIPGKRGAFSLYNQIFNYCDGIKLRDTLNEYVIIYVKDKEGEDERTH